MKLFYKAIDWITESTLRTGAGLSVLFVFAVAVSSAATTQTASYDVTNNPQMYLDASITATQTANIKLSALQRNGETVIFPNMTGGVLRMRQGTRVEDLSFTGATVNATTKIVTLAGVTRNICWNIANRLVSCGDGYSFSKGAITELNIDARLLNFKANKDRANAFTASGSITFSGSGSLGYPTFATTAARDQALGANPGGPVRAACVTATGLCYKYIGGAWAAEASGTTANASDTVAGKMQDGLLNDLQNRTMTGATGALNALTFRWIVKNGSGAETYGRILQAGNNGALSPSLGGTGLSSPTASGVLIGNGSKNSMLQITASSGQVLRANSKGSWFAATLSPTLSQWSQPNEKIASINGDVSFTTNYTIPAGYATGSVVVIKASGTGASTSTQVRYGLKLGSTEICVGNYAAGSSTNIPWRVEGELTVLRNGVAGALSVNCLSSVSTNSTLSGSIVAINTTTTNAVNVFLRAGGTSAYSYLINLFATTFSR